MRAMITDNYGNLIEPASAATINERLDAGDARMSRIESELESNTAATRQVAESTRDLVEFFEAAQGAFKVLNWIGKAAKPVGYLAAAWSAGLGFWTALKGHFKW